MAAPICEILGVGARGPLGLNALQVAMCARAGKIEPFGRYRRELVTSHRIVEPRLDTLAALPAPREIAFKRLRRHGSLLRHAVGTSYFLLCSCACGAAGLLSMWLQPALLAQYSHARQVSAE